jgi:hypothetical protein
MKIFNFGASHSDGYKDLSVQHFINYKEWLDKPFPPVWIEILSDKFRCEYGTFARGGISNQEIFFNFTEQCSNFKKGDVVIIGWASRIRTMWIKDNTLLSMSPHQTIHEKIESDIPYIKETYKNIHKKKRHPLWVLEIKKYETIIEELAKHIGFRVYYWFTDDVLLSTIKEFWSLKERKYLLNDLIDKKYGKKIYELLEPYPQSENPLNTDYFTNDEVWEDVVEKIKMTSWESNKCCMLFGVLQEYGGTNIQEETNGVVEDKYHLGSKGHEVQAELFYNYIKKDINHE